MQTRNPRQSNQRQKHTLLQGGNHMKLTPGQTEKEKQYYIKIQKKNAERERLPRGIYQPKN